jgi:hypothetical protein
MQGIRCNETICMASWRGGRWERRGWKLDMTSDGDVLHGSGRGKSVARKEAKLDAIEPVRNYLLHERGSYDGRDWEQRDKREASSCERRL